MKPSSFFRVLTAGGLGLLLGACAESPAVPQVASQNLAAQSPEVKTCQTDYATGSHYDRRTICMTEDDEKDADQSVQQTMATYRALSGSRQRQTESGGH